MSDMSPDASPGEVGKSGVRRVNNVPLFILGGAVGLFLIVMMLVASDRSANRTTDVDHQPIRTVASATNFAHEIAGQNLDGIIPSDSDRDEAIIRVRDRGVAPPVKEINQEATGERLASSDYVHFEGQHPGPAFNPTDRRRSNENAIRDDDLARMRMMRMQQLEDAIRSRTSVSGFRTAGTTGGTSNASPQEQLRSVSNALDGMRNTSDPTQMYNERVKQIEAMMGGGMPGARTAGLGGSSGGSGGGASLLNRSGGRDWRLNSTMDIPATPYVLRAGYVIPGILISGINSDLPGQIMAQVSQNVYDTATGRFVLVPQGSRLVGSYSSEVAYGQSRVLVAWDRIIFPDGKALDIAGMPGADSAGYSGYKDKVNTHFWRTFSSAFLMSGIVAGVNISQDAGGADSLNNRRRASDAMSEALGQQLGQAMTQMIMKNLNVAPTINIRPGFRFNVMVNKDMVFDTPYQAFDY